LPSPAITPVAEESLLGCRILVVDDGTIFGIKSVGDILAFEKPFATHEQLVLDARYSVWSQQQEDQMSPLSRVFDRFSQYP